MWCGLLELGDWRFPDKKSGAYGELETVAMGRLACGCSGARFEGLFGLAAVPAPPFEGRRSRGFTAGHLLQVLGEFVSQGTRPVRGMDLPQQPLPVAIRHFRRLAALVRPGEQRSVHARCRAISEPRPPQTAGQLTDEHGEVAQAEREVAAHLVRRLIVWSTNTPATATISG